MVSFEAVNVMSPRTPTLDMLMPVRPTCGMVGYVIIIISIRNRHNLKPRVNNHTILPVLPLTDEDELYLVKLLNARMSERVLQQAS